MDKNLFFNPLERPLLTGIGVFIAALLLTQSLTYQQYLINKKTEQESVSAELGAVQNKLTTALSNSLGATKTLAYIVTAYGIPDNFEAVAQTILETNPFIDALQLTQQGTITHVYPLKEHEATLGYNILDDPKTREEAERAIARQSLYFAGPFELKQGGTGIVGRLPMFKDDAFKGFAVVIIRLSTMLKASGLTKGTEGFRYQFSKIHPITGNEEFFIQSGVTPNSPGVLSVLIPEGDWKIYVAPENPTGFAGVAGFALLGLLFSVIASFYAYTLVVQPSRLSDLVTIRSKELEKAQQNYKATLERVSDAFVALDTDWRYTYMNEKAGKIFNCNPEKMIGKHIWTEFPEGIGQPFYKACYKAMKEQQYIYMEEHYPPYDRWFENHIYPSPNGLSIYLKDVTERKKSEQAILQAYKEKENVLNRITDGVVSLDNNWCYTFLNEASLATHPLGREETIGKNIWEVHPGMKGTIFWDKYHEAMETRKLVEVESYYLPMDKWFSVSIYPSADGLTLFYKDNTAAKKYEQEIIESRAKLQAILENTTDYIWSIDRHYKLLFCNTPFRKFVRNLSGREIDIGNDINDFVPAAHRAYLIELCNRALKGEQFVTERKREYGNLITYVEYYFNPIRNDAHEVTGVSVFMENITERKKVELELANERILSDFIINSLPGIFYLFDVNGKFIRWNRNFELVSGYSAEEMAEMTPLNFFDEDEKELVREKIENVFKSGKDEVDAHFFTKHGEKIPYYFNGIRVTLNEQSYLIGVGLDITERMKAKESLEKREQYFRKIIENISDGIVLIDKTGSISFQSPSVERITGYTLQNLRELTLGKLNHPTDRRDDLAFFAKLIANPGSSVRKTHRLKTKGGQYIWIDGTYTNLLHENGVNSIIYIFSDVTETKIAELALRASEGKYRFLFDNSPLPMWIFDIETLGIFEVNNAAVEHYGYSQEEFMGMTIKDIRPKEDVVKIEQIDRTIPSTNTLRLGHWRHKKKNGEIIFVNMAGHEMNYNGRRSMIVVSIDVTEQYFAQQQLKESHERLTKLTNRVPAMIYELEMDSNGIMRFPFLSKGVELIWPTVQAEKLRKSTVTEFRLIHDEDVDRFKQSILESYNNLNEWEVEFRTNEKIGPVKWIQGSSRPERKPDGTVVWYGYMQDISNLKKTEETLRALNEDLRKQAEELVASNQELERFAYVASHDLQEPLRMVSSFLQLLEKKYNKQLDAQAQQYIYYAVDGAERMKQLILDLLTYSRLGTQAQIFESVNLNQTLDDVRASLKALIQENHVVLHAEPLPNVHAIPTQMFQLFQNLISNGIKYRKPGQTPHIHIRSRENPAFWSIEVEDNGIGIDERFYERIFIVFQRLHNRSEHSGTGIGLAICKKIVERHGGSIGVNSKPGKGSTFYFSIPKLRS